MSDPRDRPNRRDPRVDPDGATPAPQGGAVQRPLPSFGNVPVPSMAASQPRNPYGPSMSERTVPVASHDDDDDDSETTRVTTIVGAPTFQATTVQHRKSPYVTVLVGNRAGEMVKLEGDEFFIGRGSQSAIHVDSDGVSRKHARIVRQGGEYILEDLGSTNGTWVDQRRIQFHRLRDGDRMQIGTDVVLRFNFHDDVEAGLQAQLYENAVRDPLTKAYNRKYFQERLRAEIGNAFRHRAHLSLIALDIDFFKRVNDTYGHPAGDEVLRGVSRVIGMVIRVEDVFARVGGEEFMVLARGTDGAAAAVLGERLRRAIEALQVVWGTHPIPVTSSFGIATITEIWPTNAAPGQALPEGDELVAIADQRLYQAKTSGRNRVVGPA